MIVRQAVRLSSAAIFLENQNKFFSQGENIGELVIDVSQEGGKRHWRVEILCSTGLSPYLVIKNITDMISMAIKKCSSYAVTMKMCDNEKGCQGRY